MPEKNTINRKEDHIRIVLERDPAFRSKSPGFEDIELVYKTLPEMDMDEVDTSTTFLGKKFSAPLMVSGMTGGTPNAREINRDIAAACEEVGIGFGVGSQRAMLEHPELADTYTVREVAPTILLAGNIGATQLNKYSTEKLQGMLKDIQADCLAVHVNAAQEAVQPDGTPHFRGVIGKIRALAHALDVPVYVKEVGAGMCKEAAAELSRCGIAALDVGGSGGTSWTGVEYVRTQEARETYWDFGIPTSVSLLEAKSGFARDIIATGGIRSGLDALKVLVLGASLAGLAAPIIKAQQKGGVREVVRTLEQLVADIRIGMFLLGAQDVKSLKNANYVLFGKTREWALVRGLQ